MVYKINSLIEYTIEKNRQSFKVSTNMVVMKKNNKEEDHHPNIEKILYVETEDKFSYPYQVWYHPLKKMCKKMLSFDPRWNFFHYGKDKTNEMFIDLIKREKPEYIFLFIGSDEFYFKTLLKIKEISPRTITFAFFSDDDIYYTSHTRYLNLFVDYGIAFQRKYLYLYKKDGYKNVFSGAVTNTGFFKPLNLEKKYDVTFFGFPLLEKSGRYQIIRYLMDKGIKIRLFGRGWAKYKEFEKIYGGAPSSEELIRILSQSKISLCLSKSNQGKTTTKTKFYEAGACKTFVLTEYCDAYFDTFKEGEDIVTFKTKEELLDKINYYLKNEGRREKIAENAYKTIKKHCDIENTLKYIFKRIELKRKNNERKELPKVNKNIIFLSEEDFNGGFNKVKDKIKDSDYIYFKKGRCQNLEFREYLQPYSLEKSKKDVSCCNYYVYSKYLGDYLYFLTHLASKTLKKEEFDSLININQLMVTKNYFLNNFDKFKRMMRGGIIDFVNEEDAVFISFPLIRIEDFNIDNYELIKKSFKLRFLYKLFSLKSQGKIHLSLYPYSVILNILSGKSFMLKAILENITDKDKKTRLETLKKASV